MTKQQTQSVEQDDAHVVAARAGDAMAFTKLVERYFGSVYAIGYGILANREVAEDLAQEAFLRVFMNMNSLRDVRAFAPWLLRTTRNLAFDWRKKELRASRLVKFVEAEAELIEGKRDERPTPQEQAEMRETREKLQARVVSLPTSQREIVLLHFGEGLSFSDTARRLGVQPSTVIRQLQRALANLREFAEIDMQQGLQAPESRREKAARAGMLILTVAAFPPETIARFARDAALPQAPPSVTDYIPTSTQGKIMTGLMLATVAGIIATIIAGRDAGNSVLSLPSATKQTGALQTVADIRVGIAEKASPQQGAVNAASSTTGLIESRQVPQSAIRPGQTRTNMLLTPSAGVTPFTAEKSSTPRVIAQSTVTSPGQNQSGLSSNSETSGTVSGRVVSEDGKPISGVHVRLEYRDYSHNNAHVMLKGISDTAGTFQIASVPAGKCRIKFLHLDFVTSNMNVTAPVANLVVKLATEGAVIEGQVIDDSGGPVPGAQIIVAQLEFDGFQQSVIPVPGGAVLTNQPVLNIYSTEKIVTDSAGYFHSEKLPAGFFDVSAKLDKQLFSREVMRSGRGTVTSQEEMLKKYIRLSEKETTSGIILTPAPPLPSGMPLIPNSQNR